MGPLLIVPRCRSGLSTRTFGPVEEFTPVITRRISRGDAVLEKLSPLEGTSFVEFDISLIAGLRVRRGLGGRLIPGAPGVLAGVLMRVSGSFEAARGVCFPANFNIADGDVKTRDRGAFELSLLVRRVS